MVICLLLVIIIIIPLTPGKIAFKEEPAIVKRLIFHNSMHALLADIKPMISNGVYFKTCKGLEFFRVVVSLWRGDIPEASKICLVKESQGHKAVAPCINCLIPGCELDNIDKTFDQRSVDDVTKAFLEMDQNRLNKIGCYAIPSAFADLPLFWTGTNVVVDISHILYPGFGVRLIDGLELYLKKEPVEVRRGVKNGLRLVSNSKYRAFLAEALPDLRKSLHNFNFVATAVFYLLFIIRGLVARNVYLLFLWFWRIHLCVHLASHTSTSLGYLESAIKTFLQLYKDEFSNLDDKGAKAKFLKLHYLLLVPLYIRTYGSAPTIIVNSFERKHRGPKKQYALISKRQDMGLGLSRMTSYNLLFKQKFKQRTKKKALRSAFGEDFFLQTPLSYIAEQYQVEETLRELAELPIEADLSTINTKVFTSCWLYRDKNSTQACNIDDDISIRYEWVEEVESQQVTKKGRWWAKVKSLFSFSYGECTKEFAVILWWVKPEDDSVDIEGDVDLDYGVPFLKLNDEYNIVSLDSLKALEQMIPVLKPEMFKKKGMADNLEIFVPATSAPFLPPFPVQ